MTRGPSTPRTQNLRARRVAAGVCVDCEDPPAPGVQRCDPCREYNRARLAEWYATAGRAQRQGRAA